MCKCTPLRTLPAKLHRQHPRFPSPSFLPITPQATGFAAASRNTSSQLAEVVFRGCWGGLLGAFLVVPAPPPPSFWVVGALVIRRTCPPSAPGRTYHDSPGNQATRRRVCHSAATTSKWSKRKRQVWLNNENLRKQRAATARCGYESWLASRGGEGEGGGALGSSHSGRTLDRNSSSTSHTLPLGFLAG
jgi:hypothetical protein